MVRFGSGSGLQRHELLAEGFEMYKHRNVMQDQPKKMTPSPRHHKISAQSATIAEPKITLCKETVNLWP
jgi:hypothetical protein